jgi:hypothetical protein
MPSQVKNRLLCAALKPLTFRAINISKKEDICMTKYYYFEEVPHTAGAPFAPDYFVIKVKDNDVSTRNQPSPAILIVVAQFLAQLLLLQHIINFVMTNV